MIKKITGLESQCEKLNLDYYSQSTISNIKVLSRTVQEGEINTSANSEKAKFLIAKESRTDLIDLYLANIAASVEYLWECRNFILTPDVLDEVIRNAYRILQKDVIIEEGFLRIGRQKHNRVAPTDNINVLYRMFLNRLSHHVQISDDYELQKLTVSYVAYTILRDHYFLDGCGKMSVLIPNFLCMQFGIPAPKITSKKDHEVNPNREQYYFPNTAEYEDHIKAWHSRYLTLFDE
jgi:hypothetical protein